MVDKACDCNVTLNYLSLFLLVVGNSKLYLTLVCIEKWVWKNLRSDILLKLEYMSQKERDPRSTPHHFLDPLVTCLPPYRSGRDLPQAKHVDISMKFSANYNGYQLLGIYVRIVLE